MMAGGRALALLGCLSVALVGATTPATGFQTLLQVQCDGTTRVLPDSPFHVAQLWNGGTRVMNAALTAIQDHLECACGEELKEHVKIARGDLFGAVLNFVDKDFESVVPIGHNDASCLDNLFGEKGAAIDLYKILVMSGMGQTRYNLPSTCNFKSWSTQGKCDMSIPLLSADYDAKTEVQISLRRCPGSHHTSIRLGCEGALCRTLTPCKDNNFCNPNGQGTVMECKEVLNFEEGDTDQEVFKFMRDWLLIFNQDETSKKDTSTDPKVLLDRILTHFTKLFPIKQEQTSGSYKICFPTETGKLEDVMKETFRPCAAGDDSCKSTLKPEDNKAYSDNLDGILSPSTWQITDHHSFKTYNGVAENGDTAEAIEKGNRHDALTIPNTQLKYTPVVGFSCGGTLRALPGSPVLGMAAQIANIHELVDGAIEEIAKAWKENWDPTQSNLDKWEVNYEFFSPAFWMCPMMTHNDATESNFCKDQLKGTFSEFLFNSKADLNGKYYAEIVQETAAAVHEAILSIASSMPPVVSEPLSTLAHGMHATVSRHARQALTMASEASTASNGKRWDGKRLRGWSSCSYDSWKSHSRCMLDTNMFSNVTRGGIARFGLAKCLKLPHTPPAVHVGCRGGGCYQMNLNTMCTKDSNCPAGSVCHSFFAEENATEEEKKNKILLSDVSNFFEKMFRKPTDPNLDAKKYAEVAGEGLPKFNDIAVEDGTDKTCTNIEAVRKHVLKAFDWVFDSNDAVENPTSTPKLCLPADMDKNITNITVNKESEGSKIYKMEPFKSVAKLPKPFTKVTVTTPNVPTEAELENIEIKFAQAASISPNEVEAIVVPPASISGKHRQGMVQENEVEVKISGGGETDAVAENIVKRIDENASLKAAAGIATAVVAEKAGDDEAKEVVQSMVPVVPVAQPVPASITNGLPDKVIPVTLVQPTGPSESGAGLTAPGLSLSLFLGLCLTFLALLA